MGVTAIVALGGNLGDVEARFKAAREELAALPHTRLLASSLLYITRPIGPPDQPDYLNAAVTLDTELEPLALLDRMQAIEERHGRVREDKWGPRTLDLDMIDYDGLCIETERLILPHPMMRERMFVVQPVSDILPQWKHPQLQCSIVALKDTLLRWGEERLAEGQEW